MVHMKKEGRSVCSQAVQEQIHFLKLRCKLKKSPLKRIVVYTRLPSDWLLGHLNFSFIILELQVKLVGGAQKSVVGGAQKSAQYVVSILDSIFCIIYSLYIYIYVYAILKDRSVGSMFVCQSR